MMAMSIGCQNMQAHSKVVLGGPVLEKLLHVKGRSKWTAEDSSADHGSGCDAGWREGGTVVRR
jgi:hypothetical protein